MRPFTLARYDTAVNSQLPFVARRNLYETSYKFCIPVFYSGHDWRGVLPGVHQIQRIRRPDHTLCSTYPLLSAGQGVFPATGVEKELSFTESKTGRMLNIYHIGLNLTAVMLVVRGVTQVVGTNLSRDADAAISGMAGIGHILLGVSLVLLLLQIRRRVSASQS